MGKIISEAYHANQATVTDEDILRMTDYFNPASCRRFLAQYWPEDHPILINSLTGSYYRWAQTLQVSDQNFYLDFLQRGYVYERYPDGKSGHELLEQVLQKISDELEPELEEKWEAAMREILNSENERTCTE